MSRRQQLIDVWVRDLADVEIMPRRVIGWELEEAEGRLYLRMPYTMLASDQLWVTYHADETYLASDTLSVNLPRELVTSRAVVYLLERILPTQDSGGQDRWGQLLRYWAEKLVKLETQHQPPSRRTKRYRWQDENLPYDRADQALNLIPNF